MPAFQYQAIDARGREKQGVIEGDNARHVRAQLRDMALVPTSVTPVREGKTTEAQSRPASRFFKKGIKPNDLCLLTRQLASLVQSGLPLEQCLRAVAEQNDKRHIKSMMMEVRSGVLEGHSLAISFGSFPHVFSDLFRSTVAAGEHAGHLDVVLERLADYVEERNRMRQKIRLALLYPSILTVLSFLIVTGLLAYVVPSVTKVFSDTGQSLPWLTSVLIATSDWVRSYGLFVLIVVVAGVVMFRLALKQESFRYRFHQLLMRVPFFAKIIKGLDTSRFARTLSILKASGVPLLEALKIASEVVNNLAIKRSVVLAANRVREGTSLNIALKDSGYFPPMAVHMIASGEKSGDLESMLERVANNQDQEFEQLMSTLLGLVGPLMVVMMGGIVLVIVLAVLLPIFEINQLVN